MEGRKAITVMAALAQPTRLAVFTRLLAALPDGITAGELASATGTAPTAMSPHLAILSRARLATSTKVGRRVVYKASPRALDELIDFLARARRKGAVPANDAARAVD